MKELKAIVIDVSHHDSVVDWEKVKALGYHTIIRCGYGTDKTSQDDKQWNRNIAEVERLDIPHGVYFYSYAKDIGHIESEVKHARRLLEGHTLQYPVYFDSEEEDTRDYAREAAGIFCRAMESSGYWAGIYASQSWWQSYLSGLEKQYTPWVARYNSEPPTVAYDGWQYSSTAKVAGVSTKCDISAFYRDFPAEIGGRAPIADVDARTQTTVELAIEVMAGSFGNGEERKQKLGDRYAEVQALINAVAKKSDAVLASMVIDGDFGNGEVRKKILGARYNAVQKVVNRLM